MHRLRKALKISYATASFPCLVALIGPFGMGTTIIRSKCEWIPDEGLLERTEGRLTDMRLGSKKASRPHGSGKGRSVRV